MRKIATLGFLLLTLTGCYPEFQLRIYTDVLGEGGASRTITYMGEPFPSLKLPSEAPWKVEAQRERYFKVTRFFADPRELKSDISFPREYPDPATFTDEDRALLDELRLKSFTPDTFFARNEISITQREWFFFTVYNYEEAFENRKVVELLRKVEGIDSVSYKLLGKDKKLEQILSRVQIINELKMPGSLIKSSSKSFNGNYCSWNFSISDFYWGYREFEMKATSIKVNYAGIAMAALAVVLLVFGTYFVRTRR